MTIVKIKAFQNIFDNSFLPYLLINNPQEKNQMEMSVIMLLIAS